MKLEMAQRIMELRQYGVTEFQVACDPGVGLYAAEIVNALRENGSAIRLVCVMPHEEQATKWTPQLRERYFNMLAGCTELDCIDFHEQPDAQLLAYQRIIKQSGVVLAVYAPDLADGSAEDRAVAYALVLGRPVMLIHPGTLKTKWLNYTPIQLKLPVDMERIIEINDSVYAFNEVVSHIDLKKYFVEKDCTATGRPRYGAKNF